MPFPTWTVSFGIWTQVTESISYNTKHYAMFDGYLPWKSFLFGQEFGVDKFEKLLQK